jgi:chromosome segregation ATPase
MMAEIMKEKARLAEMARSLNQSVRAKEAEFVRKTQFMKQEVLNREEQIRKGQLAVGRVREQLSLANSSSERLKLQISNLETQESASRQKVQTAERLVQVAKEDALAAQRLAENLKGQLAQAGAAGRKVELVQKELIASKAQTEKAVKQIEDMKKLTGQLTEKLTAATQATSGAGGTEDLKRKLEAAGRLTAVHKKEAETFKAKMETSVKEEARLRSEVTKLQAEMKRMKALSEMNAGAAAQAAVKKPGGPGGKAA